MDHTALFCLLGFAAWQIVLVLTIGTMRTIKILTGEKKANEFPSGQPHGSDFYWRVNRAHVNTAENLAVFAATVLVGNALGVSGGTFALLAQIWLGARIAQSAAHIASGSNLAVYPRFTAFAAQIGCFFGMAWQICRAV